MNSKIFNTHHITIDKLSLAKLPCASFGKDVIVIDNVEDVDSAIDELEEAAILGFDTETKPAFRKGVVNKVSLMQLSTSDKCFLFRLNKIGFHERLIKLLENPAQLKVGLSLRDDFHNLNKLRKLEPAGFIDLQKYVKEFHIADSSLTRIHAILFGERISKGQRLSNWEADTLTDSQKNYAALDAYVCIRIYKHLVENKFDPFTSPYLQPIPVPENEE